MNWLMAIFLSWALFDSFLTPHMFARATVCVPLDQCDYYLKMLEQNITGLPRGLVEKAKTAFLRRQTCGLDVEDERQKGNSNSFNFSY